MKKLIYLIPLIAVTSLFSSPSFADNWKHHHGHGWGHRHGNHPHHFYRGPNVSYYYPAPTVYYAYPQPQVNYYVPAPPPPVAYYPQAPAYGYPDRRNPSGLAGGVVGSVFGYELGNGDPVATGIGAAAGSLLGNGINGRY